MPMVGLARAARKVSAEVFKLELAPFACTHGQEARPPAVHAHAYRRSLGISAEWAAYASLSFFV